MLRDHVWIARHIPHQGTMCLLDQVLDWDLSRVRCLSRAHRSMENPLRAHGRLGAACGIEFAAQAMAVHGALLAPDPEDREPGAGYLVSVRSVALHVACLDDIEDDLVVAADRLGGDDTTVLYQFSLSAGSRTLLTGRAAILIKRSESL
ncbi:MAG: 3-hydroxylacyl-ACP dehydratase [Steroidobacterales bacterium]